MRTAGFSPPPGSAVGYVKRQPKGQDGSAQKPAPSGRSPRPSLRRARILASELGDDILVDRAQADDQWAHEALFRRYVSPLTSLMAQMVGNHQDADDIVQDAFAEAFGSLGRLRDPAAFRGWLFRIAFNRARKLLRWRRMLRLFGLSGALDDASLHMSAVPSAGPEAIAELRLLDRVLAKLPAEERMAWLLRHVAGESLETTAEWLGRSVATVKRRVAAAKAAIDEHVEASR